MKKQKNGKQVSTVVTNKKNSKKLNLIKEVGNEFKKLCDTKEMSKEEFQAEKERAIGKIVLFNGIKITPKKCVDLVKRSMLEQLKNDKVITEQQFKIEQMEFCHTKNV